MRRALNNKKRNHYPYSFRARAWSERFYLWRDEGTASHFPGVLMTGGEIRGAGCRAKGSAAKRRAAAREKQPVGTDCFACTLALLRATRGKRYPVSTEQVRRYSTANVGFVHPCVALPKGAVPPIVAQPVGAAPHSATACNTEQRCVAQPVAAQQPIAISCNQGVQGDDA